MKVDDFDFDLPAESIALHPAEPRDSARMLVVRPGEALVDGHVRDLLTILRAGDVLVVNDTRVLPAELTGTRIRGELRANVSFNLHKRVDTNTWRAFARPAKKLHLLDRLELGDNGSIAATVTGKGETGEITLAFDLGGAELDEAIKAHGAMPLPPYIEAKRHTEERDKTDYQTVYAARDGAVAAPTAGLHFTESLLQQLADLGVSVERVTLHVGAGTFLPVKVDDTDDHVMHAEWGDIPAAVVERILAARAKGGRVIAVGTTSLRLLETAARATGTLQPFVGDTDIFITPGYRFNAVDMLMTNFHLPRSTLFMLVSAFAGLNTMRAAYRHAIDDGYRFYSYGDSSLLFRAEP
ncbi:MULTISPECIES: tRNA preQ1(34) S-adenosylmethionine ribosyltransferase-isomerase QueA [unclassified Devosia]|uniref:tRNA preQ1(34) S-adenosylmethionine ribosyltransferase-isomerase QueA n=1 Tax=unclassified Devosia TaxID=196773 RepID=UPI00086AA513|nr:MULTISPECIES: tRNA preQ1(34) S-adenosylmethionine ribosyltransferase-isomerase QueA [unclassified Devosia]MBN9361238.1 tRNA preQ1(34) S-adenosylmethionine ribosyltransferase-isomerase QueA [Devosia sp.]ODS83091.1 MAG: tRNA preQ1(34) S-adenosylmethionine ribosyltransferase-isomerase QueA [Devosia sp. SCN 66-27]OJX26331.1 MAG: tRNA preQ1(34) S-adenosylmethionine ribosyltransferase-isomerase QueA [Devosia sp. 66-14]